MKGMSKTLGLVVTASVLLISASIVIFMTEGGLTDVITGSQEQSCISQVQSRCQYGTGDSFPAPEACDEADINVEEIDGVDSGDADGTITCE